MFIVTYSPRPRGLKPMEGDVGRIILSDDDPEW
jgi:hypothetical protein